MPTKKKVVAKKKASKKKPVTARIHLDVTLKENGLLASLKADIGGEVKHLAAMMAQTMDTYPEFKEVVEMAFMMREMHGIGELLNPERHKGHGCDLDTTKKAPKKPAKKSK